MGGCEGWCKENPVFSPEDRVFYYILKMMSKGQPLKLFLFLSLAVHVLVFSTFSIYFPTPKISPAPVHPVKVSLLPITVEKKEPVKKVKQKAEVRNPAENGSPVPSRVEPEKPIPVVMPDNEPPPLQTAETWEPVIKDPLPVRTEEERKTIPVEKAEIASPIKKQEKEEKIPLSAPSLPHKATVAAVRELDRSASENGQGEPKGISEEKVVIASPGNSIPPGRPPQTSGVEANIAPSIKNEIVFAQPRYAENPRPIYPREARLKGYEGEVVLRVEVLSSGRVGEIEIRRSSGHHILDRSAITAVKQWTFIPAKKDESPIPVWVNIPVTFQLR